VQDNTTVDSKGNVHFNFHERSEFLALRRCSGEQARSPSIFTSVIGSAASLVEETWVKPLIVWTFCL